MPPGGYPVDGDAPMEFQRRLKLLILLFVAILLGSFGVAGYLLVRSARQTTAQAVVTSVSDAELLARAEQFLRKQQTEQALVLYRRALTSTAGSLEAQLGLARGELMRRSARCRQDVTPRTRGRRESIGIGRVACAGAASDSIALTTRRVSDRVRNIGHA